MEGNSKRADATVQDARSGTRGRLRLLLQEHPSGLSVTELAAALGLKQNGVRKHLAALAATGEIVAGSRPSMAAGRPARVYRPVSQVPGYPHRMLARMLLRAIEGVDADEAERIALTSGPPQTLDDMLGSLGFAPAEITPGAERRAGRRIIELRACPFLDLLDAPHGHLVCAFHRGLVRRDMPEGASLDAFRVVPEGPRCTIELSGVPATAAA